MPKPIPEGFHTITPHLVVKGAAEAIDFYKRAFGAVEIARMPMPCPDGAMKIGHAELRIGDSVLFLADEFPEYGSVAPSGGGGISTSLHLYVSGVDAAYARAVEAGATPTVPLANMFWGDRYGKLSDPYGHHWSLGEHIEDVTPEQMMERMAGAKS
jgi:uncharacterized glyoxalase superfamily protein PhnB